MSVQNQTSSFVVAVGRGSRVIVQSDEEGGSKKKRVAKWTLVKNNRVRKGPGW